ncbi:response regulator transcription factor [Bacillus cytotoxicus]|uniref:DNA-binding response regulator n=2 Tax=Bacillus cytotoxicus TaxID=580165 RepID=A0AAX2CGS1_9BACI|nr:MULTISPECIES: response regulator transcription factor [Bacillus cereus group]ABS22113.1 two component transcriptional regulator, winged helix family [Bacillus cytotoxicus NVH 391-98]AWC28720.1 DNA-binding response regulator [Bacillus cytotoxicus]AWC32738.1 DNA-binding response regulator [Bacillus cytotoxicus]AWC36766.1 DNA-binding response regulator [Bacillus cytotoxicus]AWC39898.1 DNA-binding response regulator [Bacillus cytotoxicus]
MNKNILIIDDDKEIVELLAVYLRNEGYDIYKAYDGDEALQMLSMYEIDLMILDIMMPKRNGLEVCQQVREHNNTVPILMLSAKAEDMDKILGLMTGADDYMIKPFNPLELMARVKALLRRSSFQQTISQVNEDGMIRIRSIEIHKHNHTVKVNGENIKLTSIEFDILYLLASNTGRVFSSEEIFERVWNEDGYGSNKTVMVHISNLRDKLETGINTEKIIHTVWGVGYKIEK